jgi:hypothetical protein
VRALRPIERLRLADWSRKSRITKGDFVSIASRLAEAAREQAERGGRVVGSAGSGQGDQGAGPRLSRQGSSEPRVVPVTVDSRCSGSRCEVADHTVGDR